MKKEYIKPEVEIIIVDFDVIQSSGDFIVEIPDYGSTHVSWFDK